MSRRGSRHDDGGREDAEYDNMMEKRWASADSEEEEVYDYEEFQKKRAAEEKEEIERYGHEDEELDQNLPSYEEDEMNTSLWYKPKEKPKEKEKEKEECSEQLDNLMKIVGMMKKNERPLAQSQQSLLFAMFMCMLYIGLLHFVVITYTLFVRSP